jgi:hypothetical protein
VLLGAILFAMAAAAGQAMRNDPMLLQRLVRGFDGVRRPGGGAGRHGVDGVSGGHRASAASFDTAGLNEHAVTHTFGQVPSQPASPGLGLSTSAAPDPAPHSGGSLGGSHGGGGAKPVPGGQEVGANGSNGLSATQAASGGQLGGSHGGGADGSSLAKHLPGTPSGGAGAPNGGLGATPNDAPGGMPNGALGGAHGGPSLAKVPIADPSPAAHGLGGGQLGGAHGAGSMHGPHLGAGPGADAVGAHASAQASPLNLSGHGTPDAGQESGWATSRGLGAAGLAASALARAESETWAGLTRCRVCGRVPETAARFCGYCGEALDQTLS